MTIQLRTPTNSRHLGGHVLMPTILDLMATAAERTQVLAPVVCGVRVDVVPVESLRLTAALALRRLLVKPVRLAATRFRGGRPGGRPRSVRNSALRCTHRIPHALRASGAIDGVPLTLRPARYAVGRIPRDRRPAVRAFARPLALLAPRLHPLRSVTALGVSGQRLVLMTLAARLGIHARSLHEYRCRLAQWRTTDPKQRAKAARVEAVEPVSDDQPDLFEEPAA